MLLLFTRVGCEQDTGQGYGSICGGRRCPMQGGLGAPPSIYEAPRLHARGVHHVPERVEYNESWYVGMCSGIRLFPAIERESKIVNADATRGESARGIFVPMDRPQPSVELTASVGRGPGAGSSAPSPVVELGPFVHGDREVGRCEIDLSYRVEFVPARGREFSSKFRLFVRIKAVRNLDYDLRRPR